MELVWSGRENRKAQARLEERLKEALPVEEIDTIGFRPATVRLPVRRSGSSGLWWAGYEIDRVGTTPRFWNAFGTFAGNGPLRIDLEINIRTADKGRTQGFFARTEETGELILMHSGVMGGGKRGCTRDALLHKLGRQVLKVTGVRGQAREGIVIGSLEDPHIVPLISSFVSEVRRFKDSLDDKR